MALLIPELNSNFAVYLDGKDELGISEVELPELSAMNTEVKGAGLAGAIETINVGHFDSLTMTLNWRTRTAAAIQLAAHKTIDLVLYSAEQHVDNTTGAFLEKQIAMHVKCFPKNFKLGKLTVSETSDTSSEFELLYIKLTYDNGAHEIEIDKLNYIFKVDGVDYLAETRACLGKN